MVIKFINLSFPDSPIHQYILINKNESTKSRKPTVNNSSNVLITGQNAEYGKMIENA